MADPREIPQLTTELVDISREYLRQEVVEPAKALGKHAGMGFGGSMVLSLGGFFLIMGLYSGLKMWLPDGAWWVVLARAITALSAGVVAAVIGWRMQADDNQ